MDAGILQRTCVDCKEAAHPEDACILAKQALGLEGSMGKSERTGAGIRMLDGNGLPRIEEPDCGA